MQDQPSDARTPRRRNGARITARDRELLGFVADHRIVLASHVQALLGISAAATCARLRALSAAGFLEREVIFHRQPACYRIVRRGLAVIGSELPPPRIDLRCYAHDIGVAWLWLAARGGTWGAMREVISERQLRSSDAARTGEEQPLGVRLGGYGPRGHERLHYPDLLLVDRDGRRIALELELSRKGRTRRERILAGYGADARIDAVLYLVEDELAGRSISASARKLGISERVHVQRVQPVARERAKNAGRSAVRGRGAGWPHAETGRGGPTAHTAGSEAAL